MSWSTYFIQECPACGRRLHIRVAHLGKQVVCQHCQRRFEASDPANAAREESRGIDLLKRADELLETVELQRRTQRAVG